MKLSEIRELKRCWKGALKDNATAMDWREYLQRELDQREITTLRRRLDVACHIKTDDAVGFDWAVLGEISTLRDELAAYKEADYLDIATDEKQRRAAVAKRLEDLGSDRSQDA